MGTLITPPSGAADVLAVKAVTDLLPDSGALTDIGVDTARLTAVRAAILTDWINGERLDLILDAVRAVTDVIPGAGALTVPSVDSAANANVVDVLGQKGDTHDGDSVMAVLHTTDEHFHSVSKTYPMLKDGPILTAAAGDWELGTAVTIIGNVVNLDNAAAADQGGAPNVVRIPATGHGLIATFDYVTIAGSVNYNGTFQVVAVSDANHFDIESAFTAETFAGGGAETSTEVVPEDFDIHDILIEAINTTGKTYQLVLYRTDTDAVACTTRAQIGANKADSSGSNIQTILLPAGTGIYGKIAIEDGDNTATMQLSLRYHTY